MTLGFIKLCFGKNLTSLCSRKGSRLFPIFSHKTLNNLFIRENTTERISNILYGPRIHISIDDKGLGRTIFEKLEQYAERTFQIDVVTKKEDTFQEIHTKCLRIALHMKGRGIKANDIVMVCSGNDMTALLPIFATLYLNAITASLDPSLSQRNCIHLLKIVPPKLIFVIPTSVQFIEGVLRALEIKPEIVVLGKHDKYLTLSDFLTPYPQEAGFVPVYPASVRNTAVIIFSSGTTGLPKGICCSHYCMLYACTCLNISIVDPKTTLTYTSFFWVSALLSAISTVLAGGRRLVMPKFTPESFLKYAEEYSLSFLFLPTTFALQFNEENTKYFKTKTLTEMRIGGSAIGADKVKQLSKYFPNTRIYILYGLTEGGGIVASFTKFSDGLSKTKFGSCGVPYINTQIKIADLDNRKTLGPYEKGEICVKTESMFTEYYQQTIEDTFDDEGFLRTGDVGYYDENNCLFFSDRTKEMFKHRSWHITPTSIEMILLEHPAVAEALIIGIPHELDDHHPMALVVLKEGQHATEEEILNFVNERVLDREKLRAGVKFVMRLPKTSTGKISRHAIRQMIFTGNYDELNNP